MKGKTIKSVFDFNSDYALLVLSDGTGVLVKVAAEVTEEGVEELIGALQGSLKSGDKGQAPAKDVETPKKDPVKIKEDKKEPDPEPEEEGEEGYTREEIEAMNFKELKALVKENNLEVDVDEFTKDDKDELIIAILKEIGLEEEGEETEEEETEEEPEDDLTWEGLVELDYEELVDLCNESKLETDPDDYDEDSVKGLRKAIAKELGIKITK